MKVHPICSLIFFHHISLISSSSPLAAGRPLMMQPVVYTSSDMMVQACEFCRNICGSSLHV